jgi:general stress protein 26
MGGRVEVERGLARQQSEQNPQGARYPSSANRETAMSGMTLQDLAEKMRDIDIAMLSTHTDGGEIAVRPMSNNREVDYDGDSYYFTWDSARMVGDIERNSKVALSFQGGKGLLGGPPFMVAVEGRAELVRDRHEFRKHWTSGLDDWFKDGVDTEGLVMIKVQAVRISYWDGEENGEVKV